MLHIFRAHGRQFAFYLLSGSTAAVVEFGSYLLLLHWHVWYITASVVAFVLSYITGFSLHKYFVFQKPDDFFKHFRRHASVEVCNAVMMNILLFLLVENLHIEKELGKFLTMGLGVGWNFLLFKFLVFV